ncbi:MAG: outer membrane protein transport protein [Chthoniobacteraceae bacterium]
MSPRGLLVPVLLIFAFAPAPRAHALGIRVLHQDSEATARGEAFTATADRPSAIYYNPAGIIQLEGDHLQLGTYHIDINVTHRAPVTGQLTETPDRLQSLAQLYYTHSLASGRAAIGLGIYSPYGFASEWPDSSPFRSYATKSQLQFLCINPVAAVRVADGLTVAAGLTVNYGHADLRRGIIVPGDEFRVDAEGWSCGFTAGVLWQPAPRHSFGAMYRSASTMTFEGDSHVRSQIPLPLASGPARFDFNFPQHVMFGYSFRPNKDWNIEVNADWTDWRDVGTVRFELASGDLFQTFNWQSAWTYKVGATRKFANGMALSAGYFFGQSATPDRNFNPAVPNIDLHVFSLGMTYRNERWDLGVTYNLGYGPTTRVRGSQPSASGQSADGEYSFIGHGLSLAVGYRF